VASDRLDLACAILTSKERLMKLIEQIGGWLSDSQTAVAFTGAGISTESGIPDFRSPGGIWATSQPVLYEDFLARADARYEYWRQKAASHGQFMDGKPNSGHLVLARWEGEGRLAALITQNIDGLHQEAGSRNVIELHGTARLVACLNCGARFDADPLVHQFLRDDAVPSCPECGDGPLKHATISFGQSLDSQVLQRAVEVSQQADLFLAMGSSLVVEPAASLPRLARQRGARLIIINRDPTPQDGLADAVVQASIGETLSAIDQALAR
jgi:NAD-dependent deacetylase